MIPISAGNTDYKKQEVSGIRTQKPSSLEQVKKAYAEQVWLDYYNRVLFDAGLITEAERNLMKNKIRARVPSAEKLIDRSIRA